MTRMEAIEMLSEMRGRYNFFDESERLFYEALSMAIEALNAQQEIIRCKDCVAYHDGMCECDSLYVHMTGDLIGVNFYPHEDFYCAYGYREDGD